MIIHSPGGSAEATEALVKYLRAKFQHIRVIIPYGAMSAPTMLACPADIIVMGKHSLFKSHRRHIDREQAKEIGLKVENSERENLKNKYPSF